MNKHQYRLQTFITEKSHNMFIHGFLSAIQQYILQFGLISTAAYIIKTSGIIKDDLVRCQLESEYENKKMLAVIDKAFAAEDERQIKKSTMNRNQVTTLDQLVIGDRFYKYSDKKKVVMAVIHVTSGRLVSVTSVTIAPANNASDTRMIKKPAEYQVVFLRHEIEFI